MCIVLNQFGYRFRNFIAKKLKRAGLAADSGIPTPQFSRTCPGIGLAFLRNRLTSNATYAKKPCQSSELVPPLSAFR